MPKYLTYTEWLKKYGETFEVCTECEGDATGPHECNCELCDQATEACDKCDGVGLNGSLAAYKAAVRRDAEKWAAFTGTTALEAS